MRTLSLGAVTILMGVQSLPAIEADARRGAEFFQEQKCNACHSVGSALQASGGAMAPNLASRLDRDYTPSGIASRMWDHAPTMWSAMAQSGMKPPSVDEQQAANLMAFFYAARYFEKPGDAARGRRAFESKKCAECHAVGNSAAQGGPPVANWGRALSDPIALATAMWNHAPKMKAEFASRHIGWPELSSQELTDILVYLQNRPEMRRSKLEFTMPRSDNGAQLFNDKGCSECHKGANSLEGKLKNMTLTDIAAAMWDHAPRMKQGGIPLTYDEMQSILGYLWAGPFFSGQGNPERGRRVFQSKQCASCHNDPASGAPQITGRAGFSTISMVSALWKHGPAMLERIRQKGLEWPQLTPSQMSDLVAYIASGDATRASR